MQTRFMTEKHNVDLPKFPNFARNYIPEITLVAFSNMRLYIECCNLHRLSV